MQRAMVSVGVRKLESELEITLAPPPLVIPHVTKGAASKEMYKRSSSWKPFKIQDVEEQRKSQGEMFDYKYTCQDTNILTSFLTLIPSDGQIPPDLSFVRLFHIIAPNLISVVLYLRRAFKNRYWRLLFDLDARKNTK